jgi:Ran GTPase-activating protein (RanGAP) involved in mRNA processing and transport
LRVEDIVKRASGEITQSLKEIKQDNEDDLAKLAEKFDGIANVADQTAMQLARADAALSGDEDEGGARRQSGSDEEGQSEPDEGEKQVEESNPRRGKK